MARNVIILGAGASASYGAPVMCNFLDSAYQIYRDLNEHSPRYWNYRRVFKALSALRAVHSKAELDLVNIESILTTFELGLTIGRLPGAKGVEEIEEVIADLKWVIVDTLERTLHYPPVSAGLLDGDIHNFIGFINGLHREGAEKIDCSFLTFNYDLLLEVVMHRYGIGVDYGICMDSNFSQHNKVLKLHGSLNWTRTADDEIRTLFLSEYYKGKLHIHGSSSYPMAVSQELFRIGSADGMPMIVPPSWDKVGAYKAISQVWAMAAQELSEATSIYILGYSLPETDSFFRQLYALGTEGESWLKRVWVFNPDRSREQVFKSMLGPGARERYQFFPESFKDGLNRIRAVVRDG